MNVNTAARAGAAAAVMTAALFCVPTAAMADDPSTTVASITVELTATGSTRYYESCTDTETWGVAAGEGSPYRREGNYQVCRYVSSGVSINPWAKGLGTAYNATATTHIVQQSYGEPHPQVLQSKCPYWMPTGPNRSATISEIVQTYAVKLVYKYGDGHIEVADTTQGTYSGNKAVSWNPGCWTR
ncbi:hypothetical protein GCM10010149_14040 [Nonomuraea roseoviolacea subsp. roseoviolacea]|uniref:Secreted protein n=1 Tax=Nonomuraea roseoviolacea subsp. carminata TaxID=160689 RepID=A0ABT1KBG1_9ACTN|nr:hypothetical protein [Nonomuraea roseoviolacea]MCP2351344.1 hypothetical protein [Nonomuraea roseoviolacea subsp. carminata]